MNHQDWNIIGWDKTEKKKEKKCKQENSNINFEDNKKIKNTDKSLGQKLIQTRIKKEWSRKQLAQYLNIAETFIIDIENGKKQPSSTILNKVNVFIQQNN